MPHRRPCSTTAVPSNPGGGRGALADADCRNVGAEQQSLDAQEAHRGLALVVRRDNADTDGFLTLRLLSNQRPGARTALAYSFALYGALFLLTNAIRRVTFKQLKRVYKIRSDPGYGTPVKPQERLAPEADAAKPAKAVARRSLENGWPAPAALNKQAINAS